MSYKHLRDCIKKKSPAEDYTLKDCIVLIDGRSFFKDSYKNSGCKSILGGEYDRYADYLKSLLKPFKECQVTCFVIFNGSMEANLEKRREIHQKVIDNANNINPEDDNAYCEPIFEKDVWKEVLNELDIKYFVTEHDSWLAICAVTSELQCPVITKNYEYSLRYLDCISPKSLTYHKESTEIKCKIFTSATVRNVFRVKHTLLPLFYTLLDESSIYFKKLAVIFDCYKPNKLVGNLLRWTRWQAFVLDKTLEEIRELLTVKETNMFFYAYNKNVHLCRNIKHYAAERHFRESETCGNEKMPIPYTNLISNGTFSGSWVIFDIDEEDAMLPALDIIFYACLCMKFIKDPKILFIGRQHDEACVWEIKKSWEKHPVTSSNMFENFIYEKMPGFDFKLLEAVPEECWILIITLVYYYLSIDSYFAYSMILSYVMMGPVSENVGVIKRSNFTSPQVIEKENDVEDKYGLKTKDCVAVIESIMDLFYVKRLKSNFNRSILHTFAEFQHVLQHMNYLNSLCGKKIKNTVYHKTINVTFVYNMYLKIKDKTNPNKYFEKRLKKSTVYDCYKRIETGFEACLMSVGLGLVEKMASVETKD